MRFHVFVLEPDGAGTARSYNETNGQHQHPRPDPAGHEKRKEKPDWLQGAAGAERTNHVLSGGNSVRGLTEPVLADPTLKIFASLTADEIIHGPPMFIQARVAVEGAGGGEWGSMIHDS